jgi:hypothetical protein
MDGEQTPRYWHPAYSSTAFKAAAQTQRTSKNRDLSFTKMFGAAQQAISPVRNTFLEVPGSMKLGKASNSGLEPFLAKHYLDKPSRRNL